jgi:hypothetical protein
MEVSSYKTKLAVQFVPAVNLDKKENARIAIQLAQLVTVQVKINA